ncbi:MFS transporter [Desulfobulbus alkaliphilus]|uniref:MFS transporter n=1 Tax=Desulfobulbus alkaliphilus TaxID=869814 RepID=UPI001965A5E7|nr:MFS transporter [Desulfobulbus alkaliphilus]MBM9537270.1 MFS transporter [Desulfobulbus alkaliphilus]
MDGCATTDPEKKTPGPVSPFSLPNIRLFIAFRLLFNARFYYPVFTILFLDYGLTLEQFALLNTVWAFTIVLAEVPSGVLADALGRKRLLVATTALMIMEMSLIAFVPLGNLQLIFYAFLINRILSGLAEAMASGADEALAYDTLVEQGLAKEWPRVLDVQMRVQSLGYIFAMTLGGLVYDPGMVNRFLGWLGQSGGIEQQMSMRYPIYLTLLFSLLALYVTLKMRDPQVHDAQEIPPKSSAGLWELTQRTLHAGQWIIRTPLALAIILFAMTLDHTLRMIVTLTSEYYRLIQLPEASFGIIGSAVAVLGLFVPRIARIMVERFSPGLNLVLVSGFALVALAGLTLFIPYFGVLPMVAVFVGLMLTSFFTSHYLNQITASHQRATVLSFKGLAFNAAYGFIGMVFAGLILHYRRAQEEVHPEWSEALVSNHAFREAIGCFPWYLGGILILVALVCVPRLLRLRLRKQHR